MLVAGTFSAAPSAQGTPLGNTGSSGLMEVTLLQLTKASGETLGIYLFSFLFSFFFFSFNFLLALYWIIVDLQCCVYVNCKTD